MEDSPDFHRLMVLGSSGYLGQEIARQAVHRGFTVTGTYCHTSTSLPMVNLIQLDLRDRDTAVEVVRAERPSIVINAARGPGDWRATADGAANAAIAASAIGAHHVLVSSDAVFSGSASPYTELDDPDPVTSYGAAKAAAETAVRALSPSGIIARTSLIVGDDGASAAEQMIRAATKGEGQLFTDDLRCPVHVTDLAVALLELGTSSTSGVFHLAGGDALSRYELGLLIAERDGLDADRILPGRKAGQPGATQLDIRLDCHSSMANLKAHVRGARDFLGV